MKPLKNPQYLDWLSRWPCYICLTRWCEQNHLEIAGVRPEAREVAATWSVRKCGRTECAHVGVRGLGQKCADIEAIPLGAKHHQHAADSHHVLGKAFWSYHNLSRSEVFETLHALYRRETGGAQ